MKPISIIIPYYKKEKYFKKTINSILNQTFRSFEVLIIFDEENLNNFEFIKQIAKRDKRIKVFLNKKNHGAGVSRNIGIGKSKSKYIAFIDADDIWDKNKLKIQYNFMKKKNLLVTHTSYQIINEKDKPISNRLAKELSYRDLLKSCDIGLSTVMLNKKVLKKNLLFPDLKTKEDYVLWLKLAKKGIIFYPIQKNLTKWRRTKSSLSSSIIQKLKDGYKVYYKYEKNNFLMSIYKLFILSFNFLKK
tara:strand:- start:1430 stop:2167 length:738 start_codon:yes stop_codon:yes gene_type:complete